MGAPSLNNERWKYVALGAFLVVFLEAASWVCILLVNSRLDEQIRTRRAIYAEQTQLISRFLSDSTRRDVFDADLGWHYRPGFRNGGDVISDQGLRSQRDYAMPRDTTRRLAAFGDSFVYCNEVDNVDCWSTLLEDSTGWEVLNYGVGGYGTDQALLRFLREGTDLDPDVILIGFAPVNIRRAVNVYRRFISASEGPFVKPRFVSGADGSLELVPMPVRDTAELREVALEPSRVRTWGENDHWYSPEIYENPLYDLSATVRLLTALWIRLSDRYLDPDRVIDGMLFNPESEGFAVQLRLLEAFRDSATARGIPSSVVIFPDRISIVRHLQGQPTVYQPLLDSLRARGVPVVDLVHGFSGRPLDDVPAWFMPGGHYSRAGNEIAARYLREQGAGSGERGAGRSTPVRRER